MSQRERLKESCNNLSYNADSAWSDSSDLYQKTNLQLYLMKKNLDQNLLKSKRPRTVKDCIPNSRLAQYSNYEYNESREMSYTPSNSSPIFFYNTLTPTEPWELPEVEILQSSTISVNDIPNFSKSNVQFESPFLEVKGLEERILKERISQNKIKEIWKKDDFQPNETQQTNNLPIQVCSTSLKNKTNYEPTYKDLEKLIQSICKQSNTILKRTNPYQNTTDCENSTNSSTSLLLLQQSLYFYRRPLYWPSTYLSNWTNQLFEQNYRDFSSDKDTPGKIPHYHQLTATDSEELEIQALEQYQGSNDNIPSNT